MALDVALGIIKEMHKPYKIKHFKRRYNNYEIRYRGPSERRKKYTFQFPDQSRSRERKLSVLYH